VIALGKFLRRLLELPITIVPKVGIYLKNYHFLGVCGWVRASLNVKALHTRSVIRFEALKLLLVKSQYHILVAQIT
jgi:D-mannonate dehydratase